MNIVSEYVNLTNLVSIGQGWEETIVKQEQSAESQSEMKISLPSMPSLYITSFLFQACEEIDRVGGHVLDRIILQNFASRLLEKVLNFPQFYQILYSARTCGTLDACALLIILSGNS